MSSFNVPTNDTKRVCVLRATCLPVPVCVCAKESVCIVWREGREQVTGIICNLSSDVRFTPVRFEYMYVCFVPTCACCCMCAVHTGVNGCVMVVWGHKRQPLECSSRVKARGRLIFGMCPLWKFHTVLSSYFTSLTHRHSFYLHISSSGAGRVKFDVILSQRYSFKSPLQWEEKKQQRVHCKGKLF